MANATPMKRARCETENHIQVENITSSIHDAVTSRERLVALDRFLCAVGYDGASGLCDNDPDMFRMFLHAGTANALCHQLGFVLYRQGSSKEEREKLCHSLSLFFNQCPQLVTEESLANLGKGFVRLLLMAVRLGMVRPVLSIWHSYSSCGFGTSLLIQKSPEVLTVVSETLRRYPNDEDVLMDALGTLKNITYYAEELRQEIVEEPGLLPGLAQLVLQDGDGKLTERVSAIFRNVAISPDTRLLLAQNSEVLCALVRISGCSSCPALRNLLNTFVSLAMDSDSCLFLVFHGDGILVEILQRLLDHDDDAVIRKRCSRTLRLMARDGAAPLLVKNTKLMETLSRRVLYDTSSDVRAEAAEALTSFAGLVKAPMIQHEAVLETLISLTHMPGISADVVARAFKHQASHSESSRAMAKHGRLLGALTHIALSPGATQAAKEDVCCAILNMSSEESNRELIATTHVFEALVHILTRRGGNHWQAHESVVKTFANLSTTPSNRQKMAKQASLLQALLHFAASTSSDSLKKEAKSVIIQLAVEL